MLSEEMIKQEQREFLETEIPLTKIPKTTLVGVDAIKVQLLQPTTAAAYVDWIVAAFQGTFETWNETGKCEISTKPFHDKERLLLKMLEKRPISIAGESAKFTFRVSNVPRSITHQMVRARKLTFGQQSLRTADAGNQSIMMPMHLAFEGDPVLRDKYSNHMRKSTELYYELIKSGVPREQARDVLPMGTTTSIVVSGDMRHFADYFRARLDDLAQAYHQIVATRMLFALEKVAPEFANVVKILMGGQ